MVIWAVIIWAVVLGILGYRVYSTRRYLKQSTRESMRPQLRQELERESASEALEERRFRASLDQAIKKINS